MVEELEELEGKEEEEEKKEEEEEEEEEEQCEDASFQYGPDIFCCDVLTCRALV